MKPTIALLTAMLFACAGSSAEPSDTSNRPSAVADSCAVTRPDFGGVASDADRAVFAYDANAPLSLKKTVESTSDGVEVSRISYTSPDGGSVTGLLFDPMTRSSLRPGMVLMHGAPGSARNMEGQARLLADHGAVVVAIDAPFARRSGQFNRFTAADSAEQVQLIKDLQRAVDVLRSRVNVDKDRIGYLGISYGGAMGALFVGVERRIKAAALVVGDGGLVSHFTGPEDRGFMTSLSCATRAGWFRAMTPIEPIRFLPGATAALLLQSGRSDELVPAPDAEALHAAAPAGRKILWYDAGHGLNQQAMYDRHDWLREQIGLDARR